MDDVYENHKRHLRALKILGSLVLVSVMSATLGISINAIQCRCANSEVIREVKHTTCIRSKTYDLPDGMDLKVCEAGREGVYVDIGYNTSVVTLNSRQWEYLFRIDALISSTVREYLHT